MATSGSVVDGQGWFQQGCTAGEDNLSDEIPAAPEGQGSCLKVCQHWHGLGMLQYVQPVLWVQKVTQLDLCRSHMRLQNSKAYHVTALVAL